MYECNELKNAIAERDHWHAAFNASKESNDRLRSARDNAMQLAESRLEQAAGAEARLENLQYELAEVKTEHEKVIAEYDRANRELNEKLYRVYSELATAKDFGEKTFNALKECEAELATAKAECERWNEVDSIKRCVELEKQLAESKKTCHQCGTRYGVHGGCKCCKAWGPSDDHIRELEKQLATAKAEIEKLSLAECCNCKNHVPKNWTKPAKDGKRICIDNCILGCYSKKTIDDLTEQLADAKAECEKWHGKYEKLASDRINFARPLNTAEENNKETKVCEGNRRLKAELATAKAELALEKEIRVKTYAAGEGER